MLMQRKVPLTQFSSRTSFNLFFTVFYGKPQGKQINKQKPITNTTVYHQLVNMTSTNIGKNWPTNPQTGGTFGGLFNNEVTKTYMRISPLFFLFTIKENFTFIWLSNLRSNCRPFSSPDCISVFQIFHVWKL